MSRRQLACWSCLGLAAVVLGFFSPFRGKERSGRLSPVPIPTTRELEELRAKKDQIEAENAVLREAMTRSKEGKRRQEDPRLPGGQAKSR
jgi:hypothetical protein